jgi:hypothetical protein
MTLPPPAALQKSEAEYSTETAEAVLFTDVTDIRDLVDRCLLPPSSWNKVEAASFAETLVPTRMHRTTASL